MNMFPFDDEELKKPEVVPPIDPIVKDAIMKKYGMADELSADAYKAAEGRVADRSSGLGWTQFAAGVGDAIAGRDPANSAKNFQAIRANIKDEEIGDLDRKRKAKMQDTAYENEMKKSQRENDQFDPKSQASMSYRTMMESQFPNVAKTYGDKWGNVSAGDADLIFKPLQLKETQDARKEAAALMAGQKRMDRDDKQSLRDQEMTTPYGVANTPDDAKQLKDAFVEKKDFDNKIKQMIDLRKKHSGGATLNREDVQRGKQLSKDVLLAYKNMAKLGVLSKSDEDIINAIIPEDPLEYNSPLAAIQGQDPILSRLEKFKNDNQYDFENTIKTRTRAGVKTAADEPPQEKDVADYASKHSISYEQALAVKQKRTSQRAGQ